MSTTNPHDGITPAMFAHISPALYAEILERHRQNEKWGEQNHPDGTGPLTRPLDEKAGEERLDECSYAQGLETLFTGRCQGRFNRNEGTWADILLEEVFEAMAEDDPRRLHAELIQVAAVATQWADTIQRRGDLPDPNSPTAKMSSLWKQDHS